MCHVKSWREALHIRFGLKFKVGARSRPATDQEIDLVARTIVNHLQLSNWGDRAWTHRTDGAERQWLEV